MRNESSGFTLIEIVVAMLLVMIAIVGLNSAFSSISAVTRDLTLRQKAVFALDSEMERLYGIYSRSKRNSSAGFVNDRAVAVCGNTSASPNNLPYVTGISGLSDFKVSTTAPSTDGNNNLVMDGVYMSESGGSVDNNIVPVDFEKRVTGKLTWNCEKNSPYYDITLYVEYPFRYTSDNPVSSSDPVLVKRETIELKTSFRM